MSDSPLAGMSVLLVEDEPLLLKRLAAAVAAQGAEVTAVGSCKEARQALADLDFDAAVLDVNLPDAWGYTPLHYAAVRGDNPLIEYLVAKGADVKAVTRLGQSVVDMTRGGRNGFFSRTPYPATEELLLELGSEYKCLNTHMRNNGDWCPGSGVVPFKDAVQDATQVTPKPGGK